MKIAGTVTSIILAVGLIAGCANVSSGPGAGAPDVSASPPAAGPQPTPSKGFTEADVAKLKWIEGTWRGMDGEKPFFERYRIENDAMVVETLADETMTKVEDSGRFELKDGGFGKCVGGACSAASSMTDTSIQFVPAVAGKGNNFRFEKQADGTWIAVLEWPATTEKPARQKIYKMEPWPRK